MIASRAWSSPDSGARGRFGLGRRDGCRLAQRDPLQGTGLRAASCPVEKLDCMHDRTAEIVAELRHPAYIPGRPHIGIGGRDMLGLTPTERLRHLWLEQVVGAGRAAAEMPLRHL